MTDQALLEEYARTGADAAFAAVVEQYIGLVYSAAYRQVRDAQHAEDVTQAVFIILARKARQAARHPGLSGWLLQTTRYAANVHIRTAIRRARREQEAIMQSENDASPEIWRQLEPHLDDAMAALGTTDRAALALRFFESKSAREIADALQLTEAAAQRRVTRALDKVRKFFGKKGIVLSAGAIAASVVTNSVQAAPAGLAAKVSVAAGKSLVTAALVSGTMKTMTWSQLKIATTIGAATLGAAIILAAAGATRVAQHQDQQPVGKIPYQTLEDAQLFVNSINPTNLVFHMIIGSSNKRIHPQDIHLTIASKTAGDIPVHLGSKGQFLNFPCDDDLRRENPPVLSDQPPGTLGFGYWMYVPVPASHTFSYSRLTAAVDEANQAFARANQTPGGSLVREISGALANADAISFVFKPSSAHKAKVTLHTADGDKEYVADAHGVVELKINPKLRTENPLVTISEQPGWIEVFGGM